MLCSGCRTEADPAAEVCFNCGKALTALTRGSVLAGRYEIVDVLGRGGMGVVYKAFDRMLEETLAIKVLRRDLTSSPEVSRRFRSEIKLARRVSHQNVCRIHEYGAENDLHYISMAFVEGTDLRQLLNRSPKGLLPADAFSVAIQVARGLDAIHSVGVIHRDLKTPNVMRDPAGVVRLMDFGIAKEFGESGSSVTATGAVMGTPEYMSPEQCRGEPLDARSDLYALGIVTFELFTGQVPFRGDSVMATLFKHIQEAPPLEGPLGERIPKALGPVLRKMLAKAREERYGSAAEVLQALEKAREQPLAPLTPARVAPSRERRGHTRLEFPVSIKIKRLDAKGHPVQEERTIADNIGRGGARVMTAMAAVAAGDTLLVEEIGGDFSTRATVRHVHVGPDRIRRLGLQFLDRDAPDRLVLTGEWRSAVSRRSGETPRTGDVGAPSTPRRASTPVPPRTRAPDVDRRTSTRLPIPLDVVLTRFSPDGSVAEEERTFTENLGRGGARVMTSLHSAVVGEEVLLTEVGGDFRTRAVVRNAFIGSDRVRRLNLDFTEREAPDRLVPESKTAPTGRGTGTPGTPAHAESARSKAGS